MDFKSNYDLSLLQMLGKKETIMIYLYCHLNSKKKICGIFKLKSIH